MLTHQFKVDVKYFRYLFKNEYEPYLSLSKHYRCGKRSSFGFRYIDKTGVYLLI